jgi:alpha-ketoglutarate-dependent taurine dioxygenase
LLVDRGVLVFREIDFSDKEQVRLATLLGNVRDEGENGIFKVTLDKANPQSASLKGSFLWHMDGTHDTVPVFASLLSGRVLSNEGGQTYFANSYAAYEALPAEKKERIEGLKAVHSVATSMRRAGVDMASGASDRMPSQTHNLVWKHKSGRKSLVIGCHASHIEGMERSEGEALLQELLDWTTQDRFVYRHEWSVGDLVIWDNTGVLHRADAYPLDSGRMMHRTTLLGEEAFA